MNDVSIVSVCSTCDYSEMYERPLLICPKCGVGSLDAHYHAEKGLAWPDALHDRPHSMWRYRELLPLRNDANIISMGEGMTPLIHSQNLGAMLGLKHLYIKDERQGPTGSFKDRQASLAISTMRELGRDEMVVASTGNVAIAYSAYASRAGIKLWVFTISSVPSEKMREVTLYGTELVKVTGTYDQAKHVATRFAESKGLALDRGVKSIAAKEAMKTLAFEIAEQLGSIYGPADGAPWRTPDWYFQAVSGGLGPVGVMKGFRELEQFNLSKGMPKLGLIQSAGCDPMVQAWEAGLDEAAPILDPQTRIPTVATGDPGIAYKMLFDDVQVHGGAFASVSDDEAYNALKTVAQLDGISVEPATALTFAGLFKLVRERAIDPDEIVVLNVSGHTFPVEKHILGDEIGRDVDVRPAAQMAIPQEGLLSALENVDENVFEVLIIEDDRNASELMSRILKSRGVTHIHQAFDGQQGIDMVHEVQPNLIILDLMMPNVDGFGVLDRLKDDEDLRDVPVVVVTAKDLTRAERARLTDQVEHLLHKGSFIDEEILQSLLDEKLGA